ncbi:hypothetical protein Nocox_40400 [Nonomuraea coxensis DSM 45129]|uniref:DUF4367 domain-containing protein n=1 Tax=Nonomuraea coxensis DSM 45129 TaxID=1122611 RepID=A0ABX8UD21_9ACTN|nr:hypothetical protein [Nonomuraea coxensis]QYC45623.1 hypothetical protein Nocox_40400 [Nonomuraea coxensis DSM 45129]
MNRYRHLAALSAAVLAATVIAAPAAGAATRPSCPTPSKAEVKRAMSSKVDRPARKSNAIKGVRVKVVPRGFAYGQVSVSRHDGVTEYGYQWSDDRDDVDRKHRSLWVRVVCRPGLRGLNALKKAPLQVGTFSGDARTAKIGGRKVLTKQGDGALGHGRYVGWVEREGVAVTVMASEPLVPQLSRIVAGITL